MNSKRWNRKMAILERNTLANTERQSPTDSLVVCLRAIKLPVKRAVKTNGVVFPLKGDNHADANGPFFFLWKLSTCASFRQ
jgi:hypothetical protein